MSNYDTTKDEQDEQDEQGAAMREGAVYRATLPWGDTFLLRIWVDAAASIEEGRR